MLMLTFPSTPSVDAISFEDGCWRSYYGSLLTAVHCKCGERRAASSITTYVPEDTPVSSSEQYFKSNSRGNMV